MSTADEKAAADRHEADAQQFIREIETVLIEGFKLSTVDAARVFKSRSELVSSLKSLLRVEAERSRDAYQRRCLESVTEALKRTW